MLMSRTSGLPLGGDVLLAVGELSRLNMRECFLRIDDNVDERRSDEDVEARVDEEGVNELLSL